MILVGDMHNGLSFVMLVLPTLQLGEQHAGFLSSFLSMLV